MSEPAAPVSAEASVDDEDDVLLPPPPARAWLLDQLAALVRARGVGPLCTAPLVEPTPEFFPDPWSGGEASVRRLARRLMRYAGLDDVPVAVTVVDQGTAPEAGTGGVAFDGLRKGTIELVVQSVTLRDPGLLVPAMARAVASAYRRVHRLPTGDDARHERLVDVTAVYLGFGRLTANATLRHSGSAGGWGRRGTRTRTRLGVLDPQSVGFLLAAQLHARGVVGKPLRAVLRTLESNPAAFVRAALPVLEGMVPPLAERLALPPRETWPPVPALATLTAPLPNDGPDDDAVEERKDEDRGVQGMNAGRPVFRVERSMALRLGKMLALPIAMLGMVVSRMQMGFEVPMWQAGAAAAVLGLLGLAIGRLVPDRRCSEPKCGQALTVDATECPRCGGTVMGVIHHPRERLAAEEALAHKGLATPGDAPEGDEPAGDGPTSDEPASDPAPTRTAAGRVRSEAPASAPASTSERREAS